MFQKIRIFHHKPKSKNLKFGDTAYINILNNIKSISSMISKKLYRPFKKEQEFINEKLESIMSKPKAMLSDISLWLDIILFIKRLILNFSH